MPTSNQLIAQFTRARRDSSLVFIEGFHGLKHALRFDADIISAVTDDIETVTELFDALCPDIAAEATRISTVDTKTFEQLSPRIPRTRVLAIAQRPEYTMPKKGRLVLLDNPKDLGNVGTIIRTCAAANIDAVLIAGDIDPWHPTVVLSAAGLQFAIPCVRIDHAEIPNDIPLVAFDERGEALDTLKSDSGIILAFGSERHGLSDTISKRAAAMYRIPMKDGVSSLNLAASVAIAAYRAT